MCAKYQITTVSVAAVVKTSNDIIAGNGSCFKKAKNSTRHVSKSEYRILPEYRTSLSLDFEL